VRNVGNITESTIGRISLSSERHTNAAYTASCSYS